MDGAAADAREEAASQVQEGGDSRTERDTNESENERTWTAGMGKLPQRMAQRLRLLRSNAEDSAQADSSLAASSDPLQDK